MGREAGTIGYEQAVTMVERMQSIRRRPMMYLGSVDPILAETFLNGFKMACHAFGIEKEFYLENLIQQVEHERGWRGGTVASVATQMLEKRIDAATIVDELFAIQIEAWQRLAERLR